MSKITKSLAFATERAEFWDLIWEDEYPLELNENEQLALEGLAEQFSEVIAELLLCCVNEMRAEVGDVLRGVPKTQRGAAVRNHSVSLSMESVRGVRSFLYSLEFAVSSHRSDGKVRLRLILVTKKRKQSELLDRLRRAEMGEGLVTDGYWVLMEATDLLEGASIAELGSKFGALGARVVQALNTAE